MKNLDKIFVTLDSDSGQEKFDWVGLLITFGGIALMIKIAVSDGLFNGFINVINILR